MYAYIEIKIYVCIKYMLSLIYTEIEIIPVLVCINVNNTYAVFLSV